MVWMRIEREYKIRVFYDRGWKKLKVEEFRFGTTGLLISARGRVVPLRILGCVE
jgi:hypothetical protein